MENSWYCHDCSSMKYGQNVRYLNCFAPSSSVALKQGEYLYGAQTVLSRLLLYEICAECSLYIYMEMTCIPGHSTHRTDRSTWARRLKFPDFHVFNWQSCVSDWSGIGRKTIRRQIWGWTKHWKNWSGKIFDNIMKRKNAF